MTATDKMTAKTEQLIGAVKETAVRVVDRERKTGNGHSQWAERDPHQAAEKAKDTAG
ncbi:CsbD family protein [Streptomyces sp. NPDC017993]|uniref:CsbD family protein n=1 Tax=Streptomyces sp. NPDC017993 TaxID=3365027 RepID=UPI0037B307AB